MTVRIQILWRRAAIKGAVGGILAVSEAAAHDVIWKIRDFSIGPH